MMATQMQIQGVLSILSVSEARVTNPDFGRTPCIGVVTTGGTGMFRLRRRMRSDFAQHDTRGEHEGIKQNRNP